MKINKQIAIHHADSDIIGLAVPIFKIDKPIASLGVYLPESRFNYKKQEQIFSELKNTAKYVRLSKNYPHYLHNFNA